MFVNLDIYNASRIFTIEIALFFCKI